MTTVKKTKGSTRKKTEGTKAPRVRQPTEAADALASASLRPTMQAVLTLFDYNKTLGQLSVETLVEQLGKQCELTSEGDLTRGEAMLTAQAHTLDAIFNTLARKANNIEYLNHFETFLRLALKAQSQCRATWETLAEMKNPQPVAFVQ